LRPSCVPPGAIETSTDAVSKVGAVAMMRPTVEAIGSVKVPVAVESTHAVVELDGHTRAIPIGVPVDAITRPDTEPSPATIENAFGSSASLRSGRHRDQPRPECRFGVDCHMRDHGRRALHRQVLDGDAGPERHLRVRGIEQRVHAREGDVERVPELAARRDSSFNRI
jgi:hypothetical protein